MDAIFIAEKMIVLPWYILKNCLTSILFLIIANTMDNLKTPFKGVAKDVKGRLACYKKDWFDSCGSGARSAFLPFSFSDWRNIL